MATATQTSLPDTVKTLYERQLLSRALPRLLHTRWGIKPIITKMGSLEWRKFPALPARTSALVEAQTPASETPTITKITVTPLFYGSFIRHSDQLELTAYDPVVSIFTDQLGEQCGLSIDTIARDDWTASASVRYAGVATSRVTVASATCKISYNDIVNALGALMAQNALPMENGRFIALIHSYTWATMLTDSTIRTTFQYAAQRGPDNPALSGFIGTFLGCDWYITSNAKVYSAAGAAGIDVYTIIFLGKESIGVAGIGGAAPQETDTAGTNEYSMTGKRVAPVEIFVKPVGSAGSEDPINQRGTVGWKASSDSAVLNSNWVLSLEHATNF